MTQEQFDYLCEKLGDPELPVEERWKSIQYIHIHGSYDPMGSFQEMYRRDQIYYVKNDVLGGGFFYLSTPDAAYDPLNERDYTISWVGLEYISEITFKGFQDYESLSDNIYSISDIMTIALGETVSPLPTWISVVPSRVKREDAEKFEPIIKSTRPITKNDFDITYYDSMNNKLDEKPTRVGKYFIEVICKGNYSGGDRSTYEIY